MITRIPLSDPPHADPEWHRRRSCYANASELGIICGEGQWGSLAQLFAEKTGRLPPREDTPAMRRGRRLERSVFEMLSDERPEWQLVRGKEHVIDEAKRQACTPDGFAKAPDRDGIGIVQAKIVARSIYRKKWLEDPDDVITGPARPPIDYLMQTMQEVRLNELSWGILAVCIKGEFGDEFQIIDVERDSVLEDRIDYNVEKFFRDYLDPGIMPPFDPQRDEQLVKALYAKDLGTAIDLCSDNRAVALVDDLTEVQASLKRMRDQEDIIKTELEAKLGHNTYGVLPDGRCLSWKTQNRKAFSVGPKSFRVLRIHKTTPEELTR